MINRFTTRLAAILQAQNRRRERKTNKRKEQNMIQKDYFMRIIEQMGKILAKVLLKK
jgi:uncharacterized protein YmfQ (DUF2313 family)